MRSEEVGLDRTVGERDLDAALSLFDVSRAYGSVRAVDQVSFQVGNGEFLAVLGPSGAGKSTTLRLIAGLEYPDSGDIRIRGKSVRSLPPYKRDIGLVLQHYALFPHMTVFENVGFPLRMRHVPKPEAAKRISDVLHIVRLGGLAHRRPSELSGGQQQRVALARALVFEPSLLLMDEPLAALDKKLREQLRFEIKSIQRRLGVSVVYVTHDQEEALSMADRVGVMHLGRVEQVGTPRELYEGPRTVFVAAFVGEGNFFDGKVAAADRQAVTIQTPQGLSILAGRGPDDNWVVGDSAVCMVRPERMTFLHDTEQQGLNRVEGGIEGAFFFGQTTTYRVRLPQGQSLKVVIPENASATRLGVGSRCTIGWGLEDAVLLPGESEAALVEIAGVQTEDA